jgi:two-component system, OmpR family, sensor kinase
LARMSAAAAGIGSSGDLSTRIEPPATRDEVQQLAETFNEMLARLESNFGAQRRFVADASHELRTPLTALRANADIMLRQIESGLVERADLTEGLSDMRNEVDRMTRLVHNLLILARADVGWRPELTPVDLTVVARDVARIAAPLRRGQMLSLELGAPDADGEDPQVLVKGNTDQLTQLMLVLLDNAFTHTPSGTHVTLGVRRDGQDALLDVMDDGPGISQEHLSRVFERFYRADEARTRTSGGTGLGLSIARWIVAVHGGTIDASSTPGGGATFRVRFNAAEAETTPLPREQPRVAIAPG